MSRFSDSNSRCNAPTSSVLFDGNIPTLTGLDGNMWASQLLALQLHNQSRIEITSDFRGRPGVVKVELVIFNCPEWGIAIQAITPPPPGTTTPPPPDTTTPPPPDTTTPPLPDTAPSPSDTAIPDTTQEIAVECKVCPSCSTSTVLASVITAIGHSHLCASDDSCLQVPPKVHTWRN